jgi:CPA2 family monovalent cation:H+ antiporter-2
VVVENDLFLDIVIVFAVAFIGSLTARALRLPVLLGYLVAGMVIGPHVLEVVGNLETVQTLAEFGVILLLFAVGVEVSFRDVTKLRNVAVFGGIAQILATVGLGYGIGTLLGWGREEAVVLGMVISLSSTMVVLKTLTDRGELQSLHGRILTGMLLVQDLAFIPMIAILPALAGDDKPFMAELGIGVLKAVAVLGVMGLIGGKALPWLLYRVTRLGSREIFVLALVAITFSTAAITEAAGLSAALGAFIAGVLLSESDFGHRALSEITPVRDMFSAMFFVSLGMLTDPMYLVDHPGTVLAVVAAVVIGKFLLTVAVTRIFKFLPHTAVMSGLGMVQIGEFSFLLAATAFSLGVVEANFLTLTVMSAVLTMAMTPGILTSGSRIVAQLSDRFPLLRPYRLGGQDSEARPHALREHVILCGLGRVGALVAESLEEHQIQFVVIDLDPNVVVHWREKGHLSLHGGSNSEAVLRAAGVKTARLMLISTGDPVSTWVTAHQALLLKPDLDIVARVRWREEGERLQQLGVQEVVWPEMEAGLEALRHSLYRYRTDRGEVETLVNRLRSTLRFGEEPDEHWMPKSEASDPTDSVS